MMRWGLLFLIIVAAGCRTRDAGVRAPEEMRFTVDEKLLGERIVDSTLGLSFSPPAHLERIADNDLAKTGSRFVSPLAPRGSGHDSHPGLRYLFADTASGSAVALFLPGAFDTSDSSSTLRGYVEEAKKQRPGAVVAGTRFRTHGCIVHQLMVAGDSLVLFRMIFSAPRIPRPVAFDFSTPHKAYGRFVKVIESVAGSVTLLSSPSL
jgi:hypothetical protein